MSRRQATDVFLPGQVGVMNLADNVDGDVGEIGS